MAGYPGLSRITDPYVRDACKHLFDEVSALRQRVTALEGTALLNSSVINANGQRLTALADPSGASDAVTLQYLRQYVAAQVETF